ncbi:MAG: hypothetical protein ABIA91_01900 [Patescibacteria group bacterium]
MADAKDRAEQIQQEIDNKRLQPGSVEYERLMDELRKLKRISS